MLSIGTEETDKGQPESVMYLEVDRIAEADELEALRASIAGAIEDVRLSVTRLGDDARQDARGSRRPAESGYSRQR